MEKKKIIIGISAIAIAVVIALAIALPLGLKSSKDKEAQKGFLDDYILIDGYELLKIKIKLQIQKKSFLF